jgi:hypothetical protein
MKSGRSAWVGFMVLVSGCSSGGSTATDHAPGAASGAPIATGGSAASVPDFVPGVAIGPVRIGMTRAELDGLKLPTKPGPITGEIVYGPYHVQFEQDRATFIHAELRELPSGVRVGGTVFDPGTKSIESIAAKLPACGKMQINEGANVIECAAGLGAVVAGGPPGIVSLQVRSAGYAAKLHPTAAPTASSAPGAACTLEPCHGLDLTCSPRPPGACTEIYKLGDFCRQFAHCEASGGACSLVKSAKFDACKSCVDACKGPGADNCESACRKKVGAL